MKKVAILLTACAICLDWTRLKGTVKSVNLKDSTVTIMNRDGDLMVVPVDYQVKLVEKNDEMRDLRHLVLDEKVTLIKTLQEKPQDDMSGMAQPEPSQRGR